MTKEDGSAKLCALLAYFFPIGLIWYLIDKKMKKNKFVAFHVYQSLAAAIVLIIGNIVAGILTFILIGLLLYPIVWIFSLIWFIQGIINSLSGKKKNLLFLKDLAKQFEF